MLAKVKHRQKSNISGDTVNSYSPLGKLVLIKGHTNVHSL